MNKKRIWISAALLAAILTGCQTKKTPEAAAIFPEMPQADQGSTQIANPFVECLSMEEARDKAGFDFILPEELENDIRIRVIPNEFFEVRNADLVLRKAKAEQAISGDYTAYAENTTIVINEAEVHARGNDGKIMSAEWQLGEFQFSIQAQEGISEIQISAWIEDIQ